MVRNILRLEGIFFFLTALYFYQLFQGNWILFVVLLFIPDISMVGYFKDKKIGTILYNLVHNYILAISVTAVGILIVKNNTVVLIGLILFAHVAIDRFFGHGLKYPINFKDTHLQKL